MLPGFSLVIPPVPLDRPSRSAEPLLQVGVGDEARLVQSDMPLLIHEEICACDPWTHQLSRPAFGLWASAP